MPKATFVVDPTVVDAAYETFMADGNELMVDTTPPSFGNVRNGIWVQVGRVYKVKHPSFLFNPDGSVAGSAIIRTERRLSKKGRRLHRKDHDRGLRCCRQFAGHAEG